MATDSSVAVKFTADISELNAGLVNLSRQFSDFASVTEASSSRSKNALDDYNEAMGELIKGSVAYRVASSFLAATVTEAAATSGALAIAAVLVGIGMAKTTLDAIQLDASLRGVAKSMAEAGNVGLIAQNQTLAGFVDVRKTIDDYVERLKEIPGVTQDDALAIQALIGSTNNYSDALNKGVVEYIASIAKTGEEAKSLATTLTRVFSDPIARGDEFIRTLDGSTASERAAFDAAVKTGNANVANAAIYDILTGRLARIGQETLRTSREAQDMQHWVGDAFGAMTQDFNAAEDAVRRENEQLEQNVAQWKARAEAIRNTPRTSEQILDTGRAAASQEQNAPLFAADATAREITSIGKSMDELRAKLKVDPENTALIRDLFNLGVALKAAQDKDKALADQMAGGSAYQRRQQDIENTSLITRQATILTLQQKIAADKDELNSFNTTQARIDAARSNLAQHTFALEKEKSAVIAAQAAIDAGEVAKGSAEELAAKQRGTEALKALYAKGSVDRLNLEKQEQSDRQAFDSVEEQIARDRETGKYNIALAGLQQREALIREEAQTGRISHSDELSELTRVNGDREALQARYFTFMRDSYADDRAQFSSYQRQLEEVAATSAARMQEVHRQVSKEINSDYKRTFEEIGSSGASAITGLITRQQTLGEATRNVATSMLSMAVQSQAKRVADYLAGLATEVTAHVAGETAKTSATTAGVTARTSAESTGLAASAATMLANALKSIGASLGMTFAGVSANQAALLGPAAPAEAAAVTAAVDAAAMGFLSLDVGTWRVPRDMLANIHAGEMVVPAFDAERFRQGGGGGGGDVYLTYNQMGRIPQGEITQHATAIAKAVANAFNNNPSLRPVF